MIVCACATRNDAYINAFVRKYLQDVRAVTDTVLVDIRIKLNQSGENKPGCGTCMGAIRDIVFEAAKDLPFDIEIKHSAQKPQEEIRRLYKKIAIEVIS
ncbi:MAG: hypothetical protein CMF60_03695 [Magnetococcales bacterium]|jgi:bacterioferritin-associated ferredoxin|nr:hypothetical protein [Magnetococcales bacterium]MEC8067096.1 hypothetical protein [Pseudomonadota bacterium]|tara:strand:+ start:16457 stop:16753 length:297 start_codon:yes stop_codon:yes gene_type:complete